MEWLADNYGIVLAIVMLAEKLVKLSPTKYDDIILDMVWMIPRLLIKMILPKVADHIAKVFKLSKVLNYVEEDNELDVQVRDIDQKCTDIGFKLKAMQTVIKDLDENTGRIDKLEEFEKQVKRKRAFKRKDG